MEVLSLLLTVLVVSGYSYILQPRLTIAEINTLGRDTNPWSERRANKQKSALSQAETDNEGRGVHVPITYSESPAIQNGIKAEDLIAGINKTKNSEGTLDTNIGYVKIHREKGCSMMKELDLDRGYVLKNMESGLKPDTNTEKTEEQEDGTTNKTLVRYREIEIANTQDREERESKLVAGMDLHKESREDVHGDTRKQLTEGQNVEETKDNRRLERLEPPSSHMEKEVATPTTQFITPFRIPPGSPPLIHNDNEFTPPDVTLSPAIQGFFSFSSVTPPTRATANQVVASVDAEMEEAVFLFRDLISDVLNATENHQHLLKQKGSEVNQPTKASIGIVNLVKVKHLEVVMKSAPKEQQIAQNIKENHNQDSPTDEPKPILELKKTNTIIQHEDTKGQGIQSNQQTTSKPIENSNKSNSTDRQTKSTSTVKLLASKSTPILLSTTQMKKEKRNKKRNNKKSQKKDRSKGKKEENGKKTKRPLKVPIPTYFPYFKDNYCPPECACYGRVVQCSDKGVEKVPYGIPYNARYILLMNNLIDSIQLDLLDEYVSMEFLVLSNNRLTDATIEGGFEGIPALKRLFLDKNLLQSVPTDLPGSLEELRLDNNQLSVMSEAAWSRCPGLLVLSLSNNSLGNRSESLPDGVLSPLGNLRTLSLDHNQLASVPLGLPLSIKELYLRGNLIEEFRGGVFTGTSELVILDMSANKLTNKGLLRESLINALHLESLNLEGNFLKQVPRHLPPSLKTLNLEGNHISSINKATFLLLPNLEHLGLARNKISKVAPGAFRKLHVLHQLDLCHNALRQVPRQLPQSLYSAAMNHNEIQSVPRDAFCWGDATQTLSKLVRVQLEHNLIDLGNMDAQAFRCLRGFQVVHFY